MLNISYNISPRLQDYLSKIEDLRKQILLAPIPPDKELSLRWEATINRIHYSLKLTGNSMKKTDMLKLLSEVTHRKTNNDQKAVLRYKKSLDYISQNWQGSQDAVDAKAIIDLHRIIGNGRLRVPRSGLQYLLDYLQARPTSPAILPDSASLGRRGELAGGRARIENPIIQAAIVNIEMEKMQLFTEYNSLIAHLTTDLFLYKYGYDFKGFLAYEAAWMDQKNPLAGGFRENHERALSTVNLTLWLEYFAGSILGQLETIVQSIKKPKVTTVDLKKSFWQLNERQKSILSYLDQPQETITNRLIQKRYKISQITASRDLAKLTNLGYLFSHGKGRSVYYTRCQTRV
jgi:Fic family protein